MNGKMGARARDGAKEMKARDSLVLSSFKVYLTWNEKKASK